MNSPILILTLFLQFGSPRAPSLPDPVAWQAALDRAGFSPGIIDGKLARKSLVALEAFQKYAGLEVTGKPDAATRKALAIYDAPAVERTTITWSDAKRVSPIPKTWPEKAQAKSLGYESLAALAAERGHCTLALLRRLNRGVNLDKLKPGDSLLIPNVGSPRPPPRIARIEIDFDEKTVSAIDRAGRVAAMFHCSIAREKSDRPSGAARVVVVRQNPDYLFDPAKWPEVKNVDRKLLIPPGPRNPVGLCWIGLSIDGYGVHGSPTPELIGKTGSHGCFRLTNWDAQRLGRMVRPGTPVRFTESSAKLTRSR